MLGSIQSAPNTKCIRPCRIASVQNAPSSCIDLVMSLGRGVFRIASRGLSKIASFHASAQRATVYANLHRASPMASELTMYTDSLSDIESSPAQSTAPEQKAYLLTAIATCLQGMGEEMVAKVCTRTKAP